MKINHLTVKGYSRFTLSDEREYFRFTPRKLITFILGSNSSGKSSLLELLLPHPLNPLHFEEGGYALLDITHQGRHYTVGLKDAKHTFIVDKEELNQGGRVTVQQQLCSDHFGIDKVVRELFIGRSSFCKSSPITRRSWFERISGVDYDYLMSAYDKVGDEYKLIKRKVSDIEVQLSTVVGQLDESLITAMRHESDDLTKRIDILLESKPGGIQPLDTLKEMITDTLRELDELAGKYYSLIAKEYHGTGPTKVPHTPEAILLELNAILKSSVEVKAVRTSIASQLSDIDTHHLAHIEGMDPDSLASELTKLKSYPPPTLPISELDSAIQYLAHYQDDLLTTPLADIPNLQDTYTKALSTKDDLLKNLETINSRIQELEAHYQHQKALESEGEVTCPKCNHSFINGFNPEVYKALKLESTDAFKHKAKIEEEMDILHEHLEVYTATIGYQDRMERVAKQCPASLYPLLYNPKYTLIDRYHYCMKLVDETKMSKEHVRRIETLETIIKGMDQYRYDKIKQLENQLYEADKSLQELALKQRDYEKLLGMHTRIGELDSKIQATTIKLKDLMSSYDRSLYGHSANRSIKEYQLRLSAIEMELGATREKRSSVESLQKELTSALAKKNELHELTRVLSPKDGMIASLIMGFIEQFIGVMNGILKQIWTYPIVILPEHNGYRFPMRVDGRLIDDISEASLSTSRVIDMAFVLCLMEQLEMQSYPLYLDELGTGYDAAHRGNLNRFIQGVLSRAEHNHIFVVSQFASEYDSYPSALTGMVIMGSKNIQIPQGARINEDITLLQ